MLATEVHLSLLLFLQRGPPRFNWVLMESKSPLSPQLLVLDMLIPPQSALGFPYTLKKKSHSVQSGHKNPPVRWMVEAGHHPLKARQWQRRGTPGEKLSPGSAPISVGRALESHRLSVRPASFTGYYSQWATFAF